VAATERSASALFAAALALPGLAVNIAAQAATPPTERTLELQYSHYQEFQPGAERMEISAPSLFVLTPVGEQWAANLFLTTDSISGASPLYHDTLSGASGEGVNDFRKAATASVTRYFERATLRFGGAYSTEDDYIGRSLSVGGSIDSEDRNTTYDVGIAFNRDGIDSTNDIANNETRRGEQLNIGITRVLSPTSIIGASLGFAHGSGYFSDPYKPLDKRPDARDETTFLLRYNKFFTDADAALRVSYRYYKDSWALDGHTLDAAWEQSLPNDFVLTPSLRFYSQSKADFYVDPPFGAGFYPGRNYSADARLSSFGAWDVGLKLGLPEFYGWRGEVKFEFYRQKNNWALGSGAELLPFSARTWQFGLKHRF
jgi:hypothetical protein